MNENPPENSNVSGSGEIVERLDFQTPEADRQLTILYRRLESLETEVTELKNKKILDETQLPKEVLEQNGLLAQPPEKRKRGRGFRPILRSEIEEAKKQSPFTAAQARYLGVAQITYRKYATMYGLYEPRPNEKGKRNIFDVNRGKYPLKEILEGKHPGVSDWMVKDKLIRSGIVPPRCNICGYDKRRIVDKKICLLLDHKDGDTTNFKLDNLQLLCLNCTFECGRGYIRRGKHMFDPDWIQGARIDEIDDRNRW